MSLSGALFRMEEVMNHTYKVVSIDWFHDGNGLYIELTVARTVHGNLIRGSKTRFCLHCGSDNRPFNSIAQDINLAMDTINELDVPDYSIPSRMVDLLGYRRIARYH